VTAIYGYYKDARTAEIVPDPEVNDIPAPEFLSDYRLEITYKEANQAISEGAETIYLIVKHNGRYVLTYKNALKIPDKHLISDINGRLCLFWNKWFYKII